MTGALLERPVPRPRTNEGQDVRLAARPASAHGAEEVDPLVVYGDFNCPWSYLAFRRSAVLRAAGLEVDWRAVEHAPRRVHGAEARQAEFNALQEEMPAVVEHLLPGERLPYDLVGFVPRTGPSVCAYAEGYAADVAGPVRKVLFEAFWMHGIDIGDPRVLRTLLVDELRSGSSPSATVREWGYPVDITGGPISGAAWRLTHGWTSSWRQGGNLVVPLLVVPGQGTFVGVEAVDWLGEQIAARGLDLEPPAASVEQVPPCRDLPTLSWVSETGGRWLRRCERRPDRRDW